MELIYNFVHGESEDAVGHGGSKYLPFFGTLFHFYSDFQPDRHYSRIRIADHDPSVPAGCALAAFCYYNADGLYLNKDPESIWRISPVPCLCWRR